MSHAPRLLAAAPLSALLVLAWACGPFARLAAAQSPPKPAPAEQADWADLAKYREADARLGPPVAGERRTIFFGDSITQYWNLDESFPGKGYIDRGIAGQTTPQMRLRFDQDVIALKPAVVVILAGTNDVAGNTGPTTNESIEDNLRSFAERSKASGITAVLASILPTARYGWRPEVEPVERILALNAWIKEYAERNGLVYLDYYSALVDANGGMRAGLSVDGVHPNEAGYAVMAPLAAEALARASR